MSRVWVYTAGNPGSELDAPQQARSLQQELRDRGVTDCAVEVWAPFRSERVHRAERQVIVLFAHDWRHFTRRDYLTVANALAIHSSSIAALAPVVSYRTEALPVDGWPERYRQLCERLVSLQGPGDLTERVIEALAGAKASDVDRAGAVSVFFSYCHQDEDLRNELGRHLKLLERAGLIQGWHDRKIVPGEEWAAEIDNHLYTCDVILLLLSADFFASDYCSEIETPVALERHRASAACAIPVVLRPVMWRQSPLAALQALPKNATPVAAWTSRDEAFVNVCEGILTSVMAWKSQPARELNPADSPRERAVSIRRRVMDAGIASEVEYDKAAMLVVLIRKPASAGLRGLFAKNRAYGIEPEEVSSSVSVPLAFPMAQPGKKPEAIDVEIAVRSPDFEPPEQMRQIPLEPDADSHPVIFMLAARKRGNLAIAVELRAEDRLVVTCPLRTFAKVGEMAPARAAIASAEFDAFAEGEAQADVERQSAGPGASPSEGVRLIREESEARRQAEHLVEQAAQLLKAGDMTSSRELLGEALALDPGNERMIALRESLERQLYERRRQEEELRHHEAVRGRAEGTRMQQRDFGEEIAEAELLRQVEAEQPVRIEASAPSSSVRKRSRKSSSVRPEEAGTDAVRTAEHATDVYPAPRGAPRSFPRWPLASGLLAAAMIAGIAFSPLLQYGKRPGTVTLPSNIPPVKTQPSPPVSPDDVGQSVQQKPSERIPDQSPRGDQPTIQVRVKAVRETLEAAQFPAGQGKRKALVTNCVEKTEKMLRKGDQPAAQRQIATCENAVRELQRPPRGQTGK
jgi:hypothetical protein